MKVTVPVFVSIKATLLFFLFCIIAIPYTSQAQSFGGIDLKSVNVDDLSDEEILNYIKKAEKRGLSQSDIEALAKQQGVSQSEIVKLRRRVEDLRKGTNNNSSPKGMSASARVVEVVEDNDLFSDAFNEETPELTENQRRIFGFDLFQKNNLTFAPNLNLPTPVDYQLGPEDVLVVDLWGATQQYLELTVSPEGTIRPENLAPIYVNGLSIEKASEKIIDRLSERNSGIKAQNGNPPSIFYQISLGNIRTINVQVVGEVANPSQYALPSLATVYTALHAAGGPTENGTFRNVRLVRDNKLLTTVDIYSFLTNGIRSGDVRLKNGDVIIIGSFDTRIELEGEVKRPGLFELKSGEKIEDLMIYSGGFNSSAFKSTITVKRNGDRDRQIINVAKEEFIYFEPKDGDLIEVGAILNRFSNRVIINGAVNREGEYQLTNDLTLKGLIEKAGGLRGDAYMTRATVYRTNEDFSQTTIPVDLVSVISGSSQDVPLLKEDIVRIISIYDIKEEFYVQVLGEISEGGIYPFFNQMTVQDLIILAGGLKESASNSLIEISRRNNNGGVNKSAEIIQVSINPDLSIASEDKNQILKPFDQIYIRKFPGYSLQQQVTVEGEALVAGVYTISRKDERISDIIKRAKGLTPYADASGAILIRRTEFSKAKSNDQISRESLQELRKKVLKDKSELMNISQTRLIRRLDRIEDNVNQNPQTDLVGSELRKEFIQDASEQDSLVRNIAVGEEEPVLIDLKRILAEPGSKYDLIVKEGDVISIPGKLQTIRIAGEVTSPLVVRFDKSYSFKDYVDRSGGFLLSAKKGMSYVQYPNGERRGVKKFLFFKKYPKVEAGSTIIVSRKPVKDKVSLQEILAITSSLATITFLVDRITN
ncbi:MAG: protein involved in polysaccharide export with SLBB domain [Marivirga sp.]|jgi:protein involved in polysaccharide export with SLBB domain